MVYVSLLQMDLKEDSYRFRMLRGRNKEVKSRLQIGKGNVTCHTLPSLVLPQPQCRWRARVKYKAAVNRFLFLTNPPPLLFNCLPLHHGVRHPSVLFLPLHLTLIQSVIKIGDNGSCNCRGFPLAHCSLLRISCMTPDCGWGQVTLRTVPCKCLLSLFTSGPKFASPPYVLLLSLSNGPLVFVLLR